MAAGLRGVLSSLPPEPAIATVQHRGLAPAPDAEPPGHRPAATALAEAVRAPGRGVATAPLVLAPAALALVLGLWGLGRQGTMWRDEAVTYEMAHRDLTALWQTLPHFDAVHGLYYLLMHGVFGLWDGGLLALRMPSVLATAAAAAGVALLGRRLAGPRAGLVAGLVYPLVPDVQRYAQEGRSYALVAACLVWAGWLLVRALDERSPRLWAGYAALMLAAGLLHEFAVLAMAAHGVTLWLRRPGQAARRGWWVAVGCVAVGLTPHAVRSAGQSAQVDWIGMPGPVALLKYAAIVVLGVGLAGFVPRASRRLTHFALPLAVLPGALLLLATPLRPLYVDRYVLCYATGLALLAGAALDAALRAGVHDPTWDHHPAAGTAAPAGAAGPRTRRRVTAVAVVAVLVAPLPATFHLRTPASRLDDVSAVARAVQAQSRPGDGLLFLPARRRVWLHGAPGTYDGLVDLALAAPAAESRTLYGAELPAAHIRARLLAADRIVVLRDPPGQPLDAEPGEAAKRAVLREHFRECGTRSVRGARVSLYARSGLCRPGSASAEAASSRSPSSARSPSSSFSSE
ncbi:glycosyltransferase family 39 protein [Streptomyces sp. CMB-StM0423]|uniref:glycosyltransferase family 39 protein n=1 Tax=Streptomyces sp. CMB-StM0423 TaxID=2059884 RepID=UPI001F45BC9B|nr:glycosyltransferase family 39 protein [Streptomyces sp. CMB-StM0423]